MTEDVFESQLFALEALLGEIAAASQWPGTQLKTDRMGGLNGSFATEAPPAGSGSAAGIGGIDQPPPDDVVQAELAAQALESCTRLIASWKLRQTAFRTQPQAEALLQAEQQLGDVARTEPVDATEVMKNMPWLLQAALDTLLDDIDTIDNNPTGGPATVARILVSMLDVIEGSNWSQWADGESTRPQTRMFAGPFASRQRH